MAPITPIAIVFASAAAANMPIAGIPAAARAVMHAAAILQDSGDAGSIGVAVPNGWIASNLCAGEIARLAPAALWHIMDCNCDAAAVWINGSDIQLALPHGQLKLEANRSAIAPAQISDLKIAGRRIIAATGKAGDGIVSRWINRPISQAITRLVLRAPGARPWHATGVAALVGLVMFSALLLGGEAGLIIGAVLFQAASIIDGVDGEIARATLRSSARGAMLDSVADAATNLGFIGGVSYNLYISGAQQAGIAGATGFAVLALGSALLALQSRREGGDFTFDTLKHRMRERPSLIKQWLIYLTMRDFYALAACLAILAGQAKPLLFVFAAAACCWFAVLGWTILVPRNSAIRP